LDKIKILRSVFKIPKMLRISLSTNGFHQLKLKLKLLLSRRITLFQTLVLTQILRLLKKISKTLRLSSSITGNLFKMKMEPGLFHQLILTMENNPSSKLKLNSMLNQILSAQLPDATMPRIRARPHIQ
jgi:hypothetical protein